MDSSRTVRILALGVVNILSLALSAPAAQSGDKHMLAAHSRAGELTRVELAMQVGGDVKLVEQDGKTHNLPMSVLANLGYDEAILAIDPAGRPTRSARYYNDTRAVIKIDKGGEKPSVDTAHRLIIAERPDKSHSSLYCATGRLRREELDMLDLPGGTLVLGELLPGKEVGVGEPWKIADDTLAALLCLDAVGWSDVQCVLGEVKDQVGDIAAAGNVSGAIAGISTEIELKIKFRFDVAAGRITNFAMLIKEKRAVGHIGPGLDTVAKVLIKITPLTESPLLPANVLNGLPKAATPALLALDYTPKNGQFRFDHDRRWFVTGDDPKLAVLRFVDKGELLAQCNISALPVVKKPIALAEFQRDIEQALGKNFGQFTGAGQSTTTGGNMLYRVVVSGTVGQLPIEWIYYLVQDRQGHRVSLAFTFQETLRERFAAADRAVIDALQFTEPQTPTAAKPAASTATRPATPGAAQPAKAR